MIRKSLFWGLTLVLVVALVSLIIRGRRMEKELAAQPTEAVQQVPPTPTRVLAPQDLEIVSSTMQLKPDHIASHDIEIQNHGSVPYGGILLKFVYLDRAGKPLTTKTYALEKTVIRPGFGLKVPRIIIQEIPASAERLQVSVKYADLLPAHSAIDD
jgi:hypothetical protein